MESGPKPMMTIGHRPVLWHIMRYYAHFGHTDFILCLGYGSATVKDYFLRYDETRSNDFVLSKGGRGIELLQSDISEWRISFIETGIDTPIGERLRRVRHLIEDDEVFLANYGDVLTDAPMNQIIDDFIASDAVGSLLAVPPTASFHVVGVDQRSRVDGINSVSTLPIWMNGGYFVLRQGIFRCPRTQRRSGRGRVPTPGRDRTAGGRPVHGVLGPDGHLEGAQPPGGAASNR